MGWNSIRDRVLLSLEGRPLAEGRQSQQLERGVRTDKSDLSEDSWHSTKMQAILLQLIMLYRRRCCELPPQQPSLTSSISLAASPLCSEEMKMQVVDITMPSRANSSGSLWKLFRLGYTEDLLGDIAT